MTHSSILRKICFREDFSFISIIQVMSDVWISTVSYVWLLWFWRRYWYAMSGCPFLTSPTSVIMNWISWHRIWAHIVACTSNWNAQNVQLKVHAPVKGSIKSKHLKSPSINKCTQLSFKSRISSKDIVMQATHIL